jgi:hypothetical protein
MSMFVSVTCLALVLALLVAIYLNVDSLPARVWAIAKRERAEDAAAAQAALQQLAAPRVAALVAALSECHAQSAAELRAQIAAAELRARLAERQAKDAGTSITIASERVRAGGRAALDRRRAARRADRCPRRHGPRRGDAPVTPLVIPEHRTMKALRDTLRVGGLPPLDTRTPEDAARIASYRVVEELLRLLRFFKHRIEEGESCRLVERVHDTEPGRLHLEIAIEPTEARPWARPAKGVAS